MARAGREEIEADLIWKSTDERMRLSHANEIDATEMGAYAVATLSVHEVDGWCVVGRTHHASGADLLMLRADDPPEAFTRFEVSGMGAGTGPAALADLQRRLEAKVAQLGRGDLSRPGIAAVVGFELAQVLVSRVHV